MSKFHHALDTAPATHVPGITGCAVRRGVCIAACHALDREIHRVSSEGAPRYRGKQRFMACAPVPALMPEVTVELEREPRLSAAPYFSASRMNGVDASVRVPLMHMYNNVKEVRG